MHFESGLLLEPWVIKQWTKCDHFFDAKISSEKSELPPLGPSTLSPPHRILVHRPVRSKRIKLNSNQSKYQIEWVLEY